MKRLDTQRYGAYSVIAPSASGKFVEADPDGFALVFATEATVSAFITTASPFVARNRFE